MRHFTTRMYYECNALPKNILSAYSIRHLFHIYSLAWLLASPHDLLSTTKPRQVRAQTWHMHVHLIPRKHERCRQRAERQPERRRVCECATAKGFITLHLSASSSKRFTSSTSSPFNSSFQILQDTDSLSSFPILRDTDSLRSGG